MLEFSQVQFYRTVEEDECYIDGVSYPGRLGLAPLALQGNVTCALRNTPSGSLVCQQPGVASRGAGSHGGAAWGVAGATFDALAPWA